MLHGKPGVIGYRLSLVFLLVECGADLLHQSFPFPRFSFINNEPQPKGDTLEDLHVDRQQLARWFSFSPPNHYFFMAAEFCLSAKFVSLSTFIFQPSGLVICFRFNMKKNLRKEKGARRIKESRKSSRQTKQLLLKTIL